MVIPVYNAVAFVEEAVSSALAQPEVKEVVLVDDGSVDGGLEVCQALTKADPRTRLITHPGGANRGASASRNLGIRNCSEPFIAFLDADDRYLPGRFTMDAEVFATHPDAGGSYNACGVHFHDTEGRRRFESRFKDHLTTITKRLPPEDLFGALIGTIPIHDLGHFHLNGLTVRGSALERMAYLLREDLVIGEDGEFSMRLAYHTRLYPASINQAVALRGVHVGNRITAVRSPALSQYIMYKALHEWAVATPVPSVAQHKIAYHLTHTRIASANTPGERWEAFRMLLRAPGVLRRWDTAEATVDIFLGKNNSVSTAARRVVRWCFDRLWAMRRGSKPIHRPSITTAVDMDREETTKE